MFSLSKNGQGQIDKKIFGEEVGLIWQVFGCQHEELSRPLTREKTSYRTCLECGALTPFDADTFETFGKFYYPPIVKELVAV